MFFLKIHLRDTRTLLEDVRYINPCTYRVHLLTYPGEIWFLLTAVEHFCIPWYWWAEILALLKGMKFCPYLLSFSFDLGGIWYHRCPLCVCWLRENRCNEELVYWERKRIYVGICHI